AERIAYELETRVPGVADDREDRGKRRLQALVFASLGRHVRLQESGVGLELGRDEEGHFLHDRPLREALADAFTLGQGIGHLRSWSPTAEEQRKNLALSRSLLCPSVFGEGTETPPRFRSSLLDFRLRACVRELLQDRIRLGFRHGFL